MAGNPQGRAIRSRAVSPKKLQIRLWNICPANCVLLPWLPHGDHSERGVSPPAFRGTEARSAGQAGMYLALMAMVVIVLAIGIAVIAIGIKPPERT